MTARVVVVGLGPAGPELITAGTHEAIERIEHRYLRTGRHPAASAVPGAASFDHHYESAATFDDVYRFIADDLVAAATMYGEVLYAVPGSPRVAERAVELLAAEPAAGRIELVVEPALSFADLAWVRLGVDPLSDGARLIDGHRFAVQAAGGRGPLLVSQCHSRAVLSDVKLAVDGGRGTGTPSTPVTILQRLGLPDEAIFDVAWDDLDRAFEPDHLTSLWIPELAAPVASELVAFTELVTTLRGECPWDRQQTHASLRRHLLEETYEVLEALDELAATPSSDTAYAHLEEELGDLLFQVAFHSTLAAEAGRFTLADVSRGVHDKLVRRHPHVFAGAEYDQATAGQTWEASKRAEKGRASVMDGIPAALPALLYASKVVKKAATVGLEVEHGELPAHLGDALLGLVAAANRDGEDGESALRAAAARLAESVRRAEQPG